jgi:1-phosphofructokinase family hexose kinase
MIVAAGLTPALQQILCFERLAPGQVNRASEAHLCASGKVLNVGLALHRLGGPCMTLALIGGSAGRSIDEEFEALGIEHRWVWAGARTRMCTTILDREGGITTELVENAGSVTTGELDLFFRFYEESLPQAQMVVLSGSLPAGAPKTFYRDLVRITPVPVVLDASGKELLEALPMGPFCIKPNREELGRTLGRPLRTNQELMPALRKIHEMGARNILVSSGAEALWASGPDGLFEFSPAKVPTVNPIGSGDCLAAGFAWGVCNGMSVHESVCFGMAAAAENASVLLPARIDPQRVKQRAREIRYRGRTSPND